MEGPIPTWIVEATGPLAGLAAIATCLWALFWGLSSGRIVPRSTVELLISSSDKALAAKDATIASLERQNEALLEANKTTKHALDALREAGSVQRAEASGHDVPSA